MSEKKSIVDLITLLKIFYLFFVALALNECLFEWKIFYSEVKTKKKKSRVSSIQFTTTKTTIMCVYDFYIDNGFFILFCSSHRYVLRNKKKVQNLWASYKHTYIVYLKKKEN